MELDPLTTGVIGMGALIVMVFLGVRVYIAATLVGMLGIVSIVGWAPGTGIVGTIPHSKATLYSFERIADVYPDRLSSFPCRHYHGGI